MDEVTHNISEGIPNDIKNLDLPDPSLLQYYKDLNSRCIWIDDEIGDTYSPDGALCHRGIDLCATSKLIIDWNKEDKGIPIEERKAIKILINSPGGDLDPTLAFVALIKMSQTPIITINMGWAFSAACLIALSGHKRLAMPNTTFLIHSGTGGTSGTFEQTTEQMKRYKQLIDKVREYILSLTSIDLKTFNKKKSTEWYIPCDEAVELGIIDKIINNFEEIF